MIRGENLNSTDRKGINYYTLYDLKLRIFKKALCQTVFPLTTHPFTWNNVTVGDLPLNY